MLLILVVGACLGIILSWTSLQLHFSTRGDTIHNLKALWHGGPLTFGSVQRADLPWANRLMIPALHQGLSALFPFLSESRCYLLLRTLSFPVALIGFGLACWRGLGVPAGDTTRAMFSLAVVLIATFSSAWEDPTDALDLLAFALGSWAALSNRFFVCLLVAAVFALNRESAAFLGGCWFLLSTRSRWGARKALEAAAIAVASYGLALGARASLLDHSTGRTYAGNFFTLGANIREILGELPKFNPLDWLSLIAVSVALLLCQIDWRNRTARLFLVLALLFLFPAFLFGSVIEIRVQIPSFVMLAFAIAASAVRERPAPGT